MAHNKREDGKSERQQLLHQNLELQKKLSDAERENLRLKAELEQAREAIAAKKPHPSPAPAPATREQWQKEVSQLKEELVQKDREISRQVKKRRARTRAHVDTLALLSETQSALDQSKLACEALKQQLIENNESHERQLAESEESFKKQLSETQGMFQKELADTVAAFNLAGLLQSWDKKEQQLEKQKTELNKTLLDNHDTWKQCEALLKHELQGLKDTKNQLQEDGEVSREAEKCGAPTTDHANNLVLLNAMLSVLYQMKMNCEAPEQQLMKSEGSHKSLLSEMEKAQRRPLEQRALMRHKRFVKKCNISKQLPNEQST